MDISHILVIYGNSRRVLEKYTGILIKEIERFMMDRPIYMDEYVNVNEYDTRTVNPAAGLHVVTIHDDDLTKPLGSYLKSLCNEYGECNVHAVALLSEMDIVQCDTCGSIKVSDVDRLSQKIKQSNHEYERCDNVSYAANIVRYKDTESNWLEGLGQTDDCGAPICGAVRDMTSYIFNLHSCDLSKSLQDYTKHVRLILEQNPDASLVRAYIGNPDLINRVTADQSINVVRLLRTYKPRGKNVLPERPDVIHLKEIKDVIRTDLDMYNNYKDFMVNVDVLVENVFVELLNDLSIPLIEMDRRHDLVGFKNGYLTYDHDNRKYVFSEIGQKNGTYRQDVAYNNYDYVDSDILYDRMNDQEKGMVELMTGIFGAPELFYMFLGVCMKPAEYAGSMFDIVINDFRTMEAFVDVVGQICWYVGNYSVNEKPFYYCFNAYTTIYVDRSSKHVGPSLKGLGQANLHDMTNHVVLRFYDNDVDNQTTDFNDPSRHYLLRSEGKVKNWKKLGATSREKVVQYLACAAAELRVTDVPPVFDDYDKKQTWLMDDDGPKQEPENVFVPCRDAMVPKAPTKDVRTKKASRKKQAGKD